MCYVTEYTKENLVAGRNFQTTTIEQIVETGLKQIDDTINSDGFWHRVFMAAAISGGKDASSAIKVADEALDALKPEEPPMLETIPEPPSLDEPVSASTPDPEPNEDDFE